MKIPIRLMNMRLLCQDHLMPLAALCYLQCSWEATERSMLERPSRSLQQCAPSVNGSRFWTPYDHNARFKIVSRRAPPVPGFPLSYRGNRSFSPSFRETFWVPFLPRRIYPEGDMVGRLDEI